ncbi:MAG: hypothetical protein AB1631_06295, partial [Acidobacteriota bacterium]
MQPKIVEDLWPVYERAIASGDIETAYHIACDAARFYEEREDFKQLGMWLQNGARCSYDQGKYKEAALMAENAARIQPDPYYQVRALVLAAGTHFLSLKYNESFHLLSEAEEICCNYPSDTFLSAFVRGCRGFLLSKIDVDQAIIDSEESARLFLKNNSSGNAAMHINNAGHLLLLAGRPKESEQRLLAGLELLNKMQNRILEACVFDSLGCVYTMTGRYT